MPAEQLRRKLRLRLRAVVRWHIESAGEMENNLRKTLRLPMPEESRTLRRIYNWTYDPR